MDKGYGQSDPRLVRYVEETFGDHDDALLEGIRARAVAAGLPDIHVSPLDGLHLEVLVRMAGARRAVELGTLAGYSAIRILRGMGEGGLLHTFEVDARHAAVAAETFRLAGVEARVRLHIGPALGYLHDIEADGPFDVVFIDADKVAYPMYLDWAAKHLRVGGTVIGDNAFLFGKVIDKAEGDEIARIGAMRAFNHALARGGRFRATMLPTGEGLAVGVKIK